MKTPLSHAFGNMLSNALEKFQEEDVERDPRGRFATKHQTSVESWSRDELKKHPETRTSEKTGKQYFKGTDLDLVVSAHKFDPKEERVDHIIVLKETTSTGKNKMKYIMTDAYNQKLEEKKMAGNAKVAKAFPQMAAKIDKDLQSPDEKTRANATIAALINTHFLRVGGGKTESKTGSVGASTLRREHIIVHDNFVSVRFKGKSGVAWKVKVTDPALVKNLREFAAGKKPGEKLFSGGPDDVNRYLKEAAGTRITAKMFRTYHSSRIVREQLAAAPEPKNAKQAKENVKKAVEYAAELLGHTPSVAKKSYIDPRIITGYLIQRGSGKKKE